MNIADIIRPIITKTYGDNGMSRALMIYLADKIENYEPRPDDEREDRARMIMMVCWNWFAGGTTADNAAREIEEALAAHEVS